MNFLMRTHPPDLILGACREFDGALAGFWSSAAQVQRDDVADMIATLPSRYGGAGWTRSALVAAAAYDASVDAFGVRPADAPASQRTRMAEVWQRMRADVEERSPHFSAHLAECAESGTSNWLRSVSALDHLVGDARTSAAMRLRLGVPHADWSPDLACPGCHLELAHGEVVHHLRGCTRIRGHNASAAHTHLKRHGLHPILDRAGIAYEAAEPRDFQVRYCRSCGLHVPVNLTDAHLSAGTCDRSALLAAKTRGPDCRIFFADGTVLVDCTEVGCATRSACHLEVAENFEAREWAKIRLYGASAASVGEELVVMAVSPNGAISPGTVALAKRVAKWSSGRVTKGRFLAAIRAANAEAQGAALINAELRSDLSLVAFRETRARNAQRLDSSAATVQAALTKAWVPEHHTPTTQPPTHCPGLSACAGGRQRRCGWST